MTNILLSVSFMPKSFNYFTTPTYTAHLHCTYSFRKLKMNWKKEQSVSSVPHYGYIFFFFARKSWMDLYIFLWELRFLKYLENFSKWTHGTKHSTLPSDTEKKWNRNNFLIFLGKTFRWQMVITWRWREVFITQTGLRVL